MKINYVFFLMVGAIFLIQSIGAEPFVTSTPGFIDPLQKTEFISPGGTQNSIQPTGVIEPVMVEPSKDEELTRLEESDMNVEKSEFASSFGPIKPYTNYPNVLNPLQAGFLPFQKSSSQLPLTLTGKGLSIQFQGVTQDEAIALIRESNPFLTRIIPLGGFGPEEDNSVIIFVFTDYSTHDELISSLHLNPHVVSIWDDMLT